jgi:hypothetical protein
VGLTKLQRNAIYQAIERSGANPKEFDLVEPDEVNPSLLDVLLKRFQVMIIHNSDSTFRFREGQRGTSTAYMIADRPTYEISSVVMDGQNLNFSIEHDFDHLIECINRWADEVNRTVGASDLWAELRRSRRLVTDMQEASSNNAPFTQEEQKQIAAQLQEIKEQLKERFELTNEQLEQVAERLDEAEEASKRMGRKDWLIFFLGTITALIITATVPAEVGEHIFGMVMQGIAHLFTGGNEPPEIPPQILT